LGNVVYISLASTACGVAYFSAVLGLVGGAPGGETPRRRESMLRQRYSRCYGARTHGDLLPM
jgi:hypothetical protein